MAIQKNIMMRTAIQRDIKYWRWARKEFEVSMIINRRDLR
jgi:hypothetical protein